MAKRKRVIPQYGTVTLNGVEYYRTRVKDADGKLMALYARTPEELYDKELQQFHYKIRFTTKEKHGKIGTNGGKKNGICRIEKTDSS